MTADRRFLATLAAVSVLTVALVLAWTRGTSRQLAVEARIGDLAGLAGAQGVPAEVLLALAVAEAHQPSPRSDAVLAKALAGALAKGETSLEAALGALGADAVGARLVLDLIERNRERWRRLIRQHGG